jgi:serine/threonine-protein kinase
VGATDDPAIGSTLAGYRLDALIARGGMGVVYRATHLALERPVALKVIARQYADDRGFRSRFLRESQLAAQLDHPAVVPVFDAREEDGELIVAMRLIEGGDLKKQIAKRGPLPPADAVALLSQIASALDAAHAAGIVHRDVKPHNILLEVDRAYLTDFGLAKALGDSGVLSDASVVGTVEYMSPEQWRGDRVGPATDIYALGCVLYEALTGVAPYGRKESDTEPKLPRGMEAVIERAVAKDPAERFATAGELIGAARECQGATPATTQVLTEPPEQPTHWLVGADADGAGDDQPRTALSWLKRSGALRSSWLIAAVLAAGAIVALVLLLGSENPSVSNPVAAGDPPLHLAADKNGVWVTSASDGTLVLLEWPYPNESSSGALRTPRVVKTIKLDRGIAGVSVGDGSVWVCNPWTGAVLRIEPTSGRVVARIAVGGHPGAIAFGGGRVWVADRRAGGITVINAAGNRVFARGVPPESTPLRLAFGAGALWVSSASSGMLHRINPATLEPSARIRVGRGPAGVTVGGGLVWVANSRSKTVTRVDPSIEAVLGDPIRIGGRPGGIDAGTDSIWVADAADGTVSRIDIESGKLHGDPISVGPDPGAVAVGGEAVWVANNGDGTVTRIRP